LANIDSCQNIIIKKNNINKKIKIFSAELIKHRWRQIEF